MKLLRRRVSTDYLCAITQLRNCAKHQNNNCAKPQLIRLINSEKKILIRMNFLIPYFLEGYLNYENKPLNIEEVGIK